MSVSLLWKTLIVQVKASPTKATVLGVLVLVLVTVIAGQLLGGPRSAAAALPAVSIAPLVDAHTGAAPAPRRARRPPLPKLSGTPVRDLFETDWPGFDLLETSRLSSATSEDASRTTATPRLVLELTLTDPARGGRHFAVINGITTVVGDRILGHVVESIEPGMVILVGRYNDRVALHMD